MNILNVWEKLQAAMIECQNASKEHYDQYLWLKGMANGYELSLRLMAENGVVPSESEPEPSHEPSTIPFIIPEKV